MDFDRGLDLEVPPTITYVPPTASRDAPGYRDGSATRGAARWSFRWSDGWFRVGAWFTALAGTAYAAVTGIGTFDALADGTFWLHLPIPLVFGGIASAAIANLVNRTSITLGRETLEIVWGPFPWRFRRSIARARIARFVVDPARGSKAAVLGVRVELHGGRPGLLARLPVREAIYLGQALERELTGALPSMAGPVLPTPPPGR